MRKWGDELSDSGLLLGYFPNAKKCWLIIKPEREQVAREVFRDTAINVTIKGHKHLGAALGSRSFLEEYVGEKVDEWIIKLLKSHHSLKPAMQPSLLVCGTAGHISYKNITRYCRIT